MKFIQNAFERPRQNIDWERFSSLNHQVWRDNNPSAPSLYVMDAQIRAINKRAKELGRGLNADEVKEITEKIKTAVDILPDLF